MPQIEAGEPCLEDDVCIDDAQCSGSPRGACTCNEGFYQDGRTCRKKVSHTWRERRGGGCLSGGGGVHEDEGGGGGV